MSLKTSTACKTLETKSTATVASVTPAIVKNTTFTILLSLIHFLYLSLPPTAFSEYSEAKQTFLPELKWHMLHQKDDKNKLPTTSSPEITFLKFTLVTSFLSK